MPISSRLITFFILLLILAACGRKPFSPEGSGFTVEMPCDPEQQSTTIETPAGSIKLIVYLCRTSDRAYLAGYSDYPLADMKGKVEPFLDGAREGALKSGNNRLISERSISLDGRPGRELHMEAPNGLRLRVRMILAGNRLYQVGVVSPKIDAESPETGKYLDSFRLIGRK